MKLFLKWILENNKNNIMPSQDKYKKCGEQYNDDYNAPYEWCTSIINDLKNNKNNTSGNEKIDNLIQEIQLKIHSYSNFVFEWIPYNQLGDIKEAGKRDFDKLYLAIWNDGPLEYNKDKFKYTRKRNEKVALKCLHNSQNITNEFLNEV